MYGNAWAKLNLGTNRAGQYTGVRPRTMAGDGTSVHDYFRNIEDEEFPFQYRVETPPLNDPTQNMLVQEFREQNRRMTEQMAAHVKEAQRLQAEAQAAAQRFQAEARTETQRVLVESKRVQVEQAAVFTALADVIRRLVTGNRTIPDDHHLRTHCQW